MARQLTANGGIPGERISNDMLLTMPPFYITRMSEIQTKFGPAMLCQIRLEDGSEHYTFLSPSVQQRTDIAKMFVGSSEEIGPVRMVESRTKSGNTVRLFEPVTDPEAIDDADLDQLTEDDLPF